MIFRKWTAITTIAAILEQRVWGWTNDKVYTNMYTFLVGHPGVGKSRTIVAARKLCEELPDFHIAPTSVTAASLVDALKAAKCQPMNPDTKEYEEYNSMFLAIDDWQVTMSDWNNSLIAGLTTFYDVISSYSEARRTKDISIKIQAPQLSILCGTTPSQLMQVTPPGSWEQGFASRTMFIYSEERKIGDSVFTVVEKDPTELIHDLTIIQSLWGQCGNSEDFISAIDTWRKNGMPPSPNHPRLLHYNSRRLVHLLKLCIIACVDRGEKLIITHEDFTRAMTWMLEAEMYMPQLFQAGAGGADTKAMEEILHFIETRGTVSQPEIIRFASRIIPATSVLRVLEIMGHSDMIIQVAKDPKWGHPIYSIGKLN